MVLKFSVSWSCLLYNLVLREQYSFLTNISFVSHNPQSQALHCDVSTHLCSVYMHVHRAKCMRTYSPLICHVLTITM